jgi:ATP phosphoribosyltransferase regulatory subunit
MIWPRKGETFSAPEGYIGYRRSIGQAMAAESAARFEALEDQAERIMSVFAYAGYERVAPSVIQPADIFLDRVGEAIRSRTYVFTDPDGQELCLRPDLTIPTCRIYLERNPKANREARYAYNGPAFRYQQGKEDALRPREFRHAGVECFGVADREYAEAEVLALALEALRSAGLRGFVLRLGDLGLFRALLEALPIPARWRGRLLGSFWRPDGFHATLHRLASPASPIADPAVAALARELDPDDREAAESRVADFLETAKLSFLGARTLGEITERLLAVAADMREQPLSADVVGVIESYLAITGAPEAAARDIARLTGEARINLGEALDRYARRLQCFHNARIGPHHATFAADFGRQFEYYSGVVFQIELPGQGVAGQIAGGGRYDGLLASIGGPADTPAVGFSIHTERLLAARGRAI